uniref:Transmembrane protein n=1 Tax=Chromera velia CCMP2878 TaxID=1169474 RepID=A0A0G4HMR8_9ALVE|eukprot:Cvel_7592.t1-p1 / transcript=Cvel_7592.t1 / gene=Cvel_7592 / organism=Chromera_velia_CCMP2878 / gene_product=hypothetical protein / transcript_product=hypothetical protein / location=Cvel_scaffold400:9303-16761(-) / protein_length=814 / sequence_SO=supercontig / SO=protein_coding / is_pseudo=false
MTALGLAFLFLSKAFSETSEDSSNTPSRLRISRSLSDISGQSVEDAPKGRGGTREFNWIRTSKVKAMNLTVSNPPQLAAKARVISNLNVGRPHHSSNFAVELLTLMKERSSAVHAHFTDLVLLGDTFALDWFPPSQSPVSPRKFLLDAPAEDTKKVIQAIKELSSPSPSPSHSVRTSRVLSEEADRRKTAGEGDQFEESATESFEINRERKHQLEGLILAPQGVRLEDGGTPDLGAERETGMPIRTWLVRGDLDRSLGSELVKEVFGDAKVQLVDGTEGFSLKGFRAFHGDILDFFSAPDAKGRRSFGYYIARVIAGRDSSRGPAVASLMNTQAEGGGGPDEVWKAGNRALKITLGAEKKSVGGLSLLLRDKRAMRKLLALVLRIANGNEDLPEDLIFKGGHWDIKVDERGEFSDPSSLSGGSPDVSVGAVLDEFSDLAALRAKQKKGGRLSLAKLLLASSFLSVDWFVKDLPEDTEALSLGHSYNFRLTPCCSNMSSMRVVLSRVSGMDDDVREKSLVDVFVGRVVNDESDTSLTRPFFGSSPGGLKVQLSERGHVTGACRVDLIKFDHQGTEAITSLSSVEASDKMHDLRYVTPVLLFLVSLPVVTAFLAVQHTEKEKERHRQQVERETRRRGRRSESIIRRHTDDDRGRRRHERERSGGASTSPPRREASSAYSSPERQQTGDEAADPPSQPVAPFYRPSLGFGGGRASVTVDAFPQIPAGPSAASTAGRRQSEGAGVRGGAGVGAAGAGEGEDPMVTRDIGQNGRRGGRRTTGEGDYAQKLEDVVEKRRDFRAGKRTISSTGDYVILQHN